MEEATDRDLVVMTSAALNAAIGSGSIEAADAPDFVAAVHKAFKALGEPVALAQPDVPTIARPQEQISASITPDALVSFEDGKSYKSLKRHLTSRGLTPETYRAKHGLPPTYPMVAESYAAKRSELARSMGLGKKRSAG